MEEIKKIRQQRINELKEWANQSSSTPTGALAKKLSKLALDLLEESEFENKTLQNCLQNQMGVVAELKYYESKKAERIHELSILLEDADIWIPQMREALSKERFVIDARMCNLEAWHKNIKGTLHKK